MDYSQDFTLHIYSATAYEFLVNVAAPDLEIYGSTDMESKDASIICYSNPSKLLGTYLNPSRHVPKSKDLRGPVVMRRAAAAGGAF